MSATTVNMDFFERLPMEFSRQKILGRLKFSRQVLMNRLENPGKILGRLPREEDVVKALDYCISIHECQNPVIVSLEDRIVAASLFCTGLARMTERYPTQFFESGIPFPYRRHYDECATFFQFNKDEVISEVKRAV